MNICERLNKLENQTPPCYYEIDVGLDFLLDTMEQFDVDINPEYQRGHVWTLEQQESFVGAFLENHRGMPPMIFNFPNGREKGAEVVDGKQRITALLAFLGGKITAKCPCGMEFHIDEIKQNKVANRIMGRYRMHWNFVELPLKQAMEYYLRLNTGGTVHTELVTRLPWEQEIGGSNPSI